MTTLNAWLPPPMLIAFAAFASLPFWITEVGLYHYLGVEILVWCIYALGFNLLLGYAGLPSFGHGAYFGIGAYAFGLAQFNLWPNLWFCLFAAVVAATLFGLLVACFISHRRGIYFALMTIAFGQMFFFIASKWTSVTKGEDGLLNIARLPVELGFATLPIQRNPAFYWFVLACFAVVSILLWRIVNSPFGKTIQAIKQNELRMAFLGYRVTLYKAAAFALSCAFSGFAGGLFAMAQGGAFVQVMNLQWSGVIVLMTLIGGGLVSFWGPILGTILYFVARDLLGAYTEAWLLWFGFMFMIVVMFKPEGLVGAWRELRAHLGRVPGARVPAALRAAPGPR